MKVKAKSQENTRTDGICHGLAVTYKFRNN